MQQLLEDRRDNRLPPLPDYDAVVEFRSNNERWIREKFRDKMVVSHIRPEVQVPEYYYELGLGRITFPEDWKELADSILDQLRIRMRDYGISIPPEYDSAQVFFELNKDPSYQGVFLEEYNAIALHMPSWNYPKKFYWPYLHEYLEYLTYRTETQNGISPRTDKNRNGALDWLREGLTDSLTSEILFASNLEDLHEHLGYRGAYEKNNTYVEILIQGIAYIVETRGIDLSRYSNGVVMLGKSTREIILEILYKANFNPASFDLLRELIDAVYSDKGGFNQFVEISAKIQIWIDSKLNHMKPGDLIRWLSIFRPNQDTHFAHPFKGSDRELDPMEIEFVNFIIGIENLDSLLRKLKEIDIKKVANKPTMFLAKSYLNFLGEPPYLRNPQNPFVQEMKDAGLL